MELLTARNRHCRFLEPQPGTSLCAQTVIDEAGEVLGSIVDLLLDLERGRIAYAVVASGGFMGLGERLVAVPWNALKAEPRQFVLQGRRLGPGQWADLRARAMVQGPREMVARTRPRALRNAPVLGVTRPRRLCRNNYRSLAVRAGG